MAYKRRASSRRSVRPRKMARRTYRRTTVPRAVRDNIVSIKRSVVLNQFSVYNSWSSLAYAFTLGNLPNYTELTALFEQYRINAIKLTFVPTCSSLDGETATQIPTTYLTQPRLYTLIDKDANVPVNNESAMLQYGNVRIIKNPTRPFTIYIRGPAVQVGTANALTIVGGAPKSKQWLDCDNYSVQHLGCGVGGIMPQAGAGTIAFNYNVIATYYMQFKGAC